MPLWCSLTNSLWYQIVLKAFLTSSNATYAFFFLLSNISKLFEKVILVKLQSSGLSLNPLQGDFRFGYSATHTAFVQEAIQSIRENGIPQ